MEMHGIPQYDLTRGELTEINRKLLAQGERICSCCGEKRRLEYFYRKRHTYKGQTREYHSGWCRTCTNAITSERQRERYHTDPNYRAAKIESVLRRYYRRRDAVDVASAESDAA